MFLFDSLLRIRSIGILNFLKRLITFLIFASPVLIWKFSNSHIDIGLERSWFYIINNSILAHLFTLLTTNALINFVTLNGIATIIIFFLTIPTIKTNNDLIIRNFVVATIIILIVHAISISWFPLTIIIQSQIIRAGVFVNFFCYLYFSGYTAELISTKKIAGNNINILIFALFFSISPLIPLVLLLLYKKIKNEKIIKLLKIMIIFIFIITLIVLKIVNVWKPGINIGPIKDDNYDIQMWAKNNSGKHDVFITSPALWWLYNLEWRVISERSTISTLSEVLEGAFLPSYIKYWKLRFEDVAPGALTQFSVDPLKNFEITRQAYYSLTKNDIIKLSKKYGAKYFVSEKPSRYQLPIIYQNNKYTIYKIY